MNIQKVILIKTFVTCFLKSKIIVKQFKIDIYVLDNR